MNIKTKKGRGKEKRRRGVLRTDEDQKGREVGEANKGKKQSRSLKHNGTAGFEGTGAHKEVANGDLKVEREEKREKANSGAGKD